MKQLSIILTLCCCLTLVNCQNNGKQAVSSNLDQTAKEASETKTETSNSDYSSLYAANSDCKLTTAEIATLFGLSTTEMETAIRETHPCSYMISYKEGGEGPFYIKVYESPKSDNKAEIDNLKSSDYLKQFTQTIEGHTVTKHPNQGYYKLLHPEYDNQLRIQFRAMLGVDKTQKEALAQKGLNAIHYLIAKYEN